MAGEFRGATDVGRGETARGTIGVTLSGWRLAVSESGSMADMYG
jgi:hypothetical protein